MNMESIQTNVASAITQLPISARQLQELKVSDALGDGFQSTVYLAKTEDNSSVLASYDVQNVAIKAYNDKMQNTMVYEGGVSSPWEEYQIMKAMQQHPSGLKVYEFGTTSSIILNDINQLKQSSAAYISMESCTGGDLFNLISKNNGGIANTQLLKHMITQILKSVQYLHEEVNYAHMDIKPENILINSDMTIKLIDFGLAHNLSYKVSNPVGTKGYRAPEVISNWMSNNVDGQVADIFSLGVVLFILAFGVPPFVQPTPSDRLYSMYLKKPEFLFRVHPATRQAYKDKTLNQDFVELISAMLAKDPSQRPQSIAEVLKNFSYLAPQDTDLNDSDSKTKLFELVSSLE